MAALIIEGDNYVKYRIPASITDTIHLKYQNIYRIILTILLRVLSIINKIFEG